MMVFPAEHVFPCILDRKNHGNRPRHMVALLFFPLRGRPSMDSFFFTGLSRPRKIVGPWRDLQSYSAALTPVADPFWFFVFFCRHVRNLSVSAHPQAYVVKATILLLSFLPGQRCSFHFFFLQEFQCLMVLPLAPPRPPLSLSSMIFRPLRSMNTASHSLIVCCPPYHSPPPVLSFVSPSPWY